MVIFFFLYNYRWRKDLASLYQSNCNKITSSSDWVTLYYHCCETCYNWKVRLNEIFYIYISNYLSLKAVKSTWDCLSLLLMLVSLACNSYEELWVWLVHSKKLKSGHITCHHDNVTAYTLNAAQHTWIISDNLTWLSSVAVQLQALLWKLVS